MSKPIGPAASSATVAFAPEKPKDDDKKGDMKQKMKRVSQIMQHKATPHPGKIGGPNSVFTHIQKTDPKK